jgi:hypothetical protein
LTVRVSFEAPRAHTNRPRVVPHRKMEDDEATSGPVLLVGVREHLLGELEKLAHKRSKLEAQMSALGEDLEEVDSQVEATRRMLGLVEATEQQLAGQGQEELHGTELQHSPVAARVEVSGGASADLAVPS